MASDPIPALTQTGKLRIICNKYTSKGVRRGLSYLAILGEDASELDPGRGFFGLASFACGGNRAQIDWRKFARRPGGAPVGDCVSLPQLTVVSVPPALETES